VGPRIEQTELNAFLSWHNQSSDDSRYRQELVRALLSGGAQVAQPRPPGYLVALLAPPSPGPGEVDRIGRELLASDALVLPRPEFVVLMHPLRDDELDRLTPLTRMPPEIEGLAGRLRIALARGRADAVPAAYREAVGVWRTLRQRDYPPGRYELTDVLTDRLLARDRHAAQVARELIAPIAASPELVHTLRHWILGDADRSRVAAALGVHPNTLDRRLRQIERRTGLTVGRHHGLHLLHLGLAADWPPRTS
jgi:sugar diacid utilization regulator